jgi:hypothetical protein
LLYQYNHCQWEVSFTSRPPHHILAILLGLHVPTAWSTAQPSPPRPTPDKPCRKRRWDRVSSRLPPRPRKDGFEQVSGRPGMSCERGGAKRHDSLAKKGQSYCPHSSAWVVLGWLVREWVPL